MSWCVFVCIERSMPIERSLCSVCVCVCLCILFRHMQYVFIDDQFSSKYLVSILESYIGYPSFSDIRSNPIRYDKFGCWTEWNFCSRFWKNLSSKPSEVNERTSAVPCSWTTLFVFAYKSLFMQNVHEQRRTVQYPKLVRSCLQCKNKKLI